MKGTAREVLRRPLRPRTPRQGDRRSDRVRCKRSCPASLGFVARLARGNRTCWHRACLDSAVGTARRTSRHFIQVNGIWDTVNDHAYGLARCAQLHRCFQAIWIHSAQARAKPTSVKESARRALHTTSRLCYVQGRKDAHPGRIPACHIAIQRSDARLSARRSAAGESATGGGTPPGGASSIANATRPIASRSSPQSGGGIRLTRHSRSGFAQVTAFGTAVIALNAVKAIAATTSRMSKSFAQNSGSETGADMPTIPRPRSTTTRRGVFAILSVPAHTYAFRTTSAGRPRPQNTSHSKSGRRYS